MVVPFELPLPIRCTLILLTHLSDPYHPLAPEPIADRPGHEDGADTLGLLGRTGGRERNNLQSQTQIN